jgi:hypothetical protein
MKRTTERADLEKKQVPEYISGCRQFEGEDLSKLFFIFNINAIKFDSKAHLSFL